MLPENERTAFCLLATRYLAGEASDSDRAQLVEGLRDGEVRALFERMQRGWEGPSETSESRCDVGAISRRVAEAIATDPSAQELSTPDGSRLGRIIHLGNWFSRPVIGAIAASIAIAAVLAGFWLRPSRPKIAAVPPITWVERSSGVSERLQLTLGDDTKITLNSGSILYYPERFGPHSRVVRFTGEAFFDVAHDEKHPFVIETPTLRIRVLGTQFNVRAFADGSEAKVALIKGKVEVTEVAPQGQPATAPKPVFLAPGQQFDFAPETRTAEVKPVSVEAATGWIEDAFIWNREPAFSAMRQLERRFGIVVEFSDAQLGARKLTGRFQGASLEEIFETLRMTEVFDYRIVRNNGKIERVILSPGKLADQPSRG